MALWYGLLPLWTGGVPALVLILARRTLRERSWATGAGALLLGGAYAASWPALGLVFWLTPAVLGGGIALLALLVTLQVSPPAGALLSAAFLLLLDRASALPVLSGAALGFALRDREAWARWVVPAALIALPVQLGLAVPDGRRVADALLLYLAGAAVGPGLQVGVEFLRRLAHKKAGGA
ncbi:MAG: hypothetical protein ACOYW4_01730 [Bacillota bacterium]